MPQTDRGQRIRSPFFLQIKYPPDAPCRDKADRFLSENQEKKKGEKAPGDQRLFKYSMAAKAQFCPSTAAETMPPA